MNGPSETDFMALSCFSVFGQIVLNKVYIKISGCPNGHPDKFSGFPIKNSKCLTYIDNLFCTTVLGDPQHIFGYLSIMGFLLLPEFILKRRVLIPYVFFTMSISQTYWLVFPIPVLASQVQNLLQFEDK